MPPAAKKPSAPVPYPISGPSAALVARANKEGLAMVPPLADEVQGLTIESEEDFKHMGGLLTDIATARKTWTAKLAPIRDPLKDAVKAAKQAASAADDLFKEVDTPLAGREAIARQRMADWKTAERRQIQAAAEEQQRIQREIDRQAEVEAYGRTAASRQKATETRQKLEEKQADVFESAPVAVQVDGIGERAVTKIRITDLARFLKFVAADVEALGDCVEVLQPRLNKWLKEDAEGVKSWPGVEVYEDTVIVRRN